jgi:hypothetical protein
VRGKERSREFRKSGEEKTDPPWCLIRYIGGGRDKAR